jgi:hypothetical protein
VSHPWCSSLDWFSFAKNARCLFCMKTSVYVFFSRLGHITSVFLSPNPVSDGPPSIEVTVHTQYWPCITQSLYNNTGDGVVTYQLTRDCVRCTTSRTRLDILLPSSRRAIHQGNSPGCLIEAQGPPGHVFVNKPTLPSKIYQSRISGSVTKLQGIVLTNCLMLDGQ